MQEDKSIIVRFEQSNEQTVGEITKVVGLVKAKYLIPVIDHLNLEANPRSSKTGAVTNAIQESIDTDYLLFPFKTKGILLAASHYERLERGRIRITPNDTNIEGILDGGHNTLAIGIYILEHAFMHVDRSFPKGAKTWDDFKTLWVEHRDFVDDYLGYLRGSQDVESQRDLDFLIPVELLLPQDPEDLACTEEFQNNLLEICAARNNNVQLNVAAKANQRGYFEPLRNSMKQHNPALAERIEWKMNDGGDIKAQDLIALAWIPLSLINPVKDEYGKKVEPPAPNKLYSGKGSCLNQFERLMSSNSVTNDSGSDYRRELKNSEVASAFEVAVQLPELYDYIYEKFPQYYNAIGGKYGRITAVKRLNEKRRIKKTPYTGKEIEMLSPEGFVVPLVYGLQALMEDVEINGYMKVRWVQDPMVFLESHFEQIVSRYSGTLIPWGYDPQKVGKASQSYNQAIDSFKMAIAGI